MKMICIGRNYVKHAQELNNEIPKEPVIFIKPETALLQENIFTIPPFSQDVHYETELILHIHKKAKNVKEEEAHNYYNKIAVGIDFTARDIQKKCKEKGLPWEKAKAFDGSAFVSTFIPKEELSLENISFFLDKVPGIRVQKGESKDMLFTFNQIIHYCSTYFTLSPGDLIFTGTTQGVGKVVEGETYLGGIKDRPLFEIQIRKNK